MEIILDNDYESLLAYSAHFFMSKKTIHRWLFENKVFLNHVVYTSGALPKGALLEIKLEEYTEILPQKPIDIVYEDTFFLVLNKPIGLVVYIDKAGDSLSNRVAYYQMLHNLDSKILPAHRIDIDTSGIILYAKNPFALAYLSHAFETQTVDKTYIACVDSSFAKEKGSIHASLIEDRHSKKMVVSKSGLTAYTSYRKISDPLYTRLEVSIDGGRKHQIRAHFASIGYPLIGDAIYGGMPHSRLLLHAKSISFKHPLTGEVMYFETQVPF